MTLKAMYEKKEDIPKGLEDEYIEKDGKWYLDAEGMVISNELSDLKKKIDDFRANNVSLTEKLKKFEGKKFLTQEEVDEFERIKKEQEDIKDQKLISEGKIEELLTNRTEKMRTDFDGKTKSLQESLDKEKAVSKSNAERLAKVLIRADVSKLLSDKGLSPVKGAMDDIFDRAAKVWRANDEGELEAKNAKDEQIFGTEGKPLTLSEWGDQIVKDAPFLFAENDGTDGKGGKKKIPAGPDGKMRIPRSNEAMKSKYVDDIASGKAIVVDG